MRCGRVGSGYSVGTIGVCQLRMGQERQMRHIDRYSSSSENHSWQAGVDRNWYKLLGRWLLGGGIGVAATSQFLLQSTPLVALGLSMVILGAICLTLERACPKVPPGVGLIFMESGLENVASMIEELGLRSRAVYVPSSLAGGKPQALIPLNSNGVSPVVNTTLPRRLIAKYGLADHEMGLLVSTPGSAATGMLESKPGASGMEMGNALTTLLVGMIDAADAVRVFDSGGRIRVEVSGSRVGYRNTRVQECLGSPLASIAASVVSEALGRPVVIEKEHSEYRGKCLIELGVLGEDI